LVHTIRYRSSPARGLRAPGTEEVRKTFRFVAPLFADGRSYGWDPVVSEVSGQVVYTAAFERLTASRNGHPPAPTELRVTHMYRRGTASGGAVHRHAT
jgi:ketosteroid isomerase-like protein